MRLLPLGGAFLALHLAQVLCLSTSQLEAERSGWNANPETQYHIQTDEGPERYFRFQTLNGQYRKEKRLEDGTVIGTEGWLDPLGYLRIKDYIADTKGFRILKSKMIFVGKDRPIGEAVSISKKAPASVGALAPPNPFRQPELKDVASNSIESGANSRSSYALQPSSTTPASVRLRPVVVTTMRPRPFSLVTPADDDDPSSNQLVSASYAPTTYRGTFRPSLTVEPPFLEQDQNHLASQNSPVRVSPNFRGYRRWNGTAISSRSSDGATNSIPSGAGANNNYNNNNVNNNVSSNNNSEKGRFPVRTRGSTRYQQHRTGDGFQYYLSKQYHEEQRPRPDKSVGSYGYVDPFGIRRVVYYKADGANGFVHRKNNRYVGHNAKPYDPLPVAAQHALH